MPNSPSPFLTMVAEEMYKKRYAKRTIESYIKWIRNFILFHNKQHPTYLHDNEVEAFLSHLVLKQDCAANTQSSALNALVFLYRDIMDKPLTLKLNFVKSNRQQKLPVVLTIDEIRCFLRWLTHIKSLQLRFYMAAVYV